LDYLDRAFEEKAHGHATQIFDRVQSAGCPGVPGGETLHGLAKQHGISRNLVRIWAAKAEAGEFADDLAAASILQEYEARIGELERLVGKLALENEFLKGVT